MDAGQSSQISSSSTSRDLISPCKGTHTLTVREYEQTIDELKKENFNLKLKLYLCDETHKKNRDKDSTNDEVVQVVVHLSSEAESLRAELKEKENLLQNALERVEKLESDCKELEKFNSDLQAELSSFSELPSKEEILLLVEEKENCINHIHSLENIIKEREEEIDTLNQKIEILANDNTRLEEKMKKRSLAIQGFVYKAYKEKEMLPDEIKSIVISATQAAKNKNKDDVAVAVRSFTSALNKVMSTSESPSSQSKENKNIESPKDKCLTKGDLEKSADSFLSSQTESSSHIAQVQVLKEILSERNIPDDNSQIKKLDSFVDYPYISAKKIHQNAVNISEKGVINVCDISASKEENILSFSEMPSLQASSVTEHNLIDIQTVSSSPTFYKLTPEKDMSGSEQFMNILKENEKLKHDLDEKLAELKELSVTCEELKRMHLQETGSDALKASQHRCISTQTKITGRKLLDEHGVRKLENDVKLSDNVEELRDNIFILLHTIEEKNKELSEVKQSLTTVQEDLEKALNTTSAMDKDFYIFERNELHEKLATSCSVNEELMKHLKNLEKFMEDLLCHKFDSSLESITDKSNSISKCLTESLNLSRILSDNLSICEGSRLFEECESFALKNSHYPVEKNLHLGLSRLSTLEQLSHHGPYAFEEYISHLPKNLRIGKESDCSQLCWRCRQQLNLPVDQAEIFHLMQNNSIPKPAGYQSSDSDIWSEPDRNVSMQRIGISLQNSPVSSKSPRKLKQKDKRMLSRYSSKEGTSSSEYQQASKKRQGSASRRLFSKENAKTQDFAFDNFYFSVAEKYSKLKSLLNDLEGIENAKLSDDGWIRLNNIVVAVGDTLQKLHLAKENAKTSSVCGKCIMLELYNNLKASYVEADFFINSASFEQKILQEFSRELFVLKETCEEPLSLSTVSKTSIASQSDILIESEQIKELETIIKDLTEENKKLDENLKQMLSKEKELASVKTENCDLISKIDNLKIDVVDMKYREKELLLKNEKLANELTHVNKNNAELNISLKNIEEKRKECSIAVDQLTAELERKRSDLTQINEKYLELEKQLNEQIHMRENSENKLKNLECESLREKNYYLCKIDDLNAEKKHYIQELKILQEKRLALEKENAVINDRLESKNNESLKSTIDKQSITETQDNIENVIDSEEKTVLESLKTEKFKFLEEINHLKEQLLDLKFKEKEFSLENKKLMEDFDLASKNNSELKAELEKSRLDLIYMNKKCQSCEKKLDEQIQIKEKLENELKTVKVNSLTEKEYYQNQLDFLNAEKENCEQEIKNIKENMLILEKENAAINKSLNLKNEELLSLKKTIEKLQSTEEVLISDHEKVKLPSKDKEFSRSIEIQNSELLSRIKQLEEELSLMKNKEKEFIHKNEKLVGDLSCLRKNNYELNCTLNDLEDKSKKSSIALDQLTAELHQNKADLIHMNEKCLEYEKILNEQILMRKDSENKLGNLQNESLSERNYYLRKIDDLNAEKSQYVQELKVLQEIGLALEKENAVINDRLQSKNSEIMSLKEMLKKLHSTKESENGVEKEADFKDKVIFESIKAENFNLSNEVNLLKEQLLDMKYKEKEFSLKNKKLIEELDHVSKNYSEQNNAFETLKLKFKESNSTADQLKAELEEIRLNLSHMNKKYHANEKKVDDLNSTLKNLKEKNIELSSTADHLEAELQKYKSDLAHMTKKCLNYENQMKEQKQMNEKFESQLKTLELNSSNEKKKYLHESAIQNSEKNQYAQELKNIKIENLKLLNHIKQVEEELLDMKNKEKELCLTNKKLVEELNEVNKNSTKLNSTLKILEQKRKESDIELDHFTAQMQKTGSDLIHMSEKCLAYKKQLIEQTQLKEKFENELKAQESNFLNEKNYYSSQINELNAEKDLYFKKLEAVQEKKLVLEQEVAAVNDSLQSKNNELLFLQKAVVELQTAKEALNSKNEELQSKLIHCQECLTNLQEKHKKCEEIIIKSKEIESDYCQQLKNLETKSTSEKEKFLDEISMLTKERDDILQKLKDEKERYKRLKAENIELNKKYTEISQQFSTLKQRNEFYENALFSSNNECDSLNKDLKCLRNTLQNLESKCLMYEKQLVATAGMKDNLTECLLNMNNEFSIQRQKLNEMCKIYGNDDSAVWNESSFTKFTPVIDEDNVSKLCENFLSETKKLSQSVDMLLSILKSYHLKFVETETSEEKNLIKNQSLKKQMEFHKTEAESLHSENNSLHCLIDKLQKSISEKDESIQSNAHQEEIFLKKLQNSQNEINRIKQLIQKKDDEITRLQERLFNLQTFVNNTLSDKKNMLEKTPSMTEKPENSVSSNNQLSSKTVSTDTKMCQTEESESNIQNLDESFTSASSLESEKKHCCEKYWKKCYSLQTKLAFCRNHIEILEKGKDDLKERLLQQLQSKNNSDEKSDSVVSQLVELESKLEKKKLFINELKSELLKTCNSLIDKEKEVDDLKQKLAECEIKFKPEALDASRLTATFSSIDANIKTLKNHKWELIQTIFDIQKKFYEKKGIHLNYFERFREHVNNLYALQLIPLMSKSESMPLLRSYSSKEQGNEKVKKLADLELDIECLENLKIFLNRFFVPHVFQELETSGKKTVIGQNVESSDPLSSPVRTENQKESKDKITDILNLSFPEAFVQQEKDLSIGVLASSVFQHLDYIKKFLNAVTNMNWLEVLNLSVEDSVNNEEVKSLLLKIFHEINVLQEGENKLFNLNAQLKSFDFVVPLQARLSAQKLDTSDRESIMSEETIAVSRTESPFSFEDNCPITLPHPETLQLEENTLKTGSIGNRVTVIEPYGTKMAVVDGSCDSVCQRSHYSSPDLGIESDPNHDSSAPEHKEDDANKYQVFPFKLPQTKTGFTSANSAGRWPGPKFGETCYAIASLPDFELLKQEIKESLVAIKSVLSRTGSGLHHIGKSTSPRKTLEYTNLKAIKDTCVHMEAYLKEAYNLVGKFWTAPCPTEEEWKMLKAENQKLSDDLICLKSLVDKQEIDFKAAMGRLERAQAVKDNIEKKISKKLVKTKKLIRQSELRLLETRCQNVPPLPKYPSEEKRQADAH